MKLCCLCGNVIFVMSGAVGDMGYCHCAQCRKQLGHYWASGTVDLSGIAVTGDAGIGLSPGLIDGPTGLTMEKHIFVASKGDYDQIEDGLLQEQGEVL